MFTILDIFPIICAVCFNVFMWRSSQIFFFCFILSDGFLLVDDAQIIESINGKLKENAYISLSTSCVNQTYFFAKQKY